MERERDKALERLEETMWEMVHSARVEPMKAGEMEKHVDRMRQEIAALTNTQATP